jgi:hypothetical protein
LEPLLNFPRNMKSTVKNCCAFFLR